MDDLERWERDLGRHADELGDKVERAVERFTLRTEALAKQFAPVDTGYLRSSITSEFSSTAGRTYSGEVTVGAHYAGYVEYGTSRMAPQPYLNPAVDVTEPEFYAACEAIGVEVGVTVDRRVDRL